MHIEVVLKLELDTDSCLNAIMPFIARRGKSSTIIGYNGTNFVGAEKEIAEFVAAWNKKRNRRTSNSARVPMEIQPILSPSLGKGMGTVRQKFQESNV